MRTAEEFKRDHDRIAESLQRDKEAQDLLDEEERREAAKIFNKAHRQLHNDYWLARAAIHGGHTDKLVQEQVARAENSMKRQTAQEMREARKQLKAQNTEEPTNQHAAQNSDEPANQQSTQTAGEQTNHQSTQGMGAAQQTEKQTGTEPEDLMDQRTRPESVLPQRKYKYTDKSTLQETFQRDEKSMKHQQLQTDVLMEASTAILIDYGKPWEASADEISMVWIVTAGRPIYVDSAHATYASAQVRYGELQKKTPAFLNIMSLPLRCGNTTIVEHIHRKAMKGAKELDKVGFLREARVHKPRFAPAPPHWADKVDETPVVVNQYANAAKKREIRRQNKKYLRAKMPKENKWDLFANDDDENAAPDGVPKKKAATRTRKAKATSSRFTEVDSDDAEVNGDEVEDEDEDEDGRDEDENEDEDEDEDPNEVKVAKKASGRSSKGKTAVKKVAAKPVKAPKKAPAKTSGAKTAGRKVRFQDDDDDDAVPQKAPAKSSRGKASAKKAVIQVIDDDDDEDAEPAEASKKTSARPSRARASSKNIIEIQDTDEDEDDEDDEDEPKPIKKPAAKKTRSAPEARSGNTAKSTNKPGTNLPNNVQALLSGSGNLLTGITIVIAGTPPVLGRKLTEELVKKYGGKITKVITGVTNYVLVGDKAGAKQLEQATDMNKAILDEDDLIAMVEGASSAGSRGKRPRPGGDDVDDDDEEDGEEEEDEVEVEKDEVEEDEVGGEEVEEEEVIAEANQAPQAPQPIKRASRRRANDIEEDEEVIAEETQPPQPPQLPQPPQPTKRASRRRANDIEEDEEVIAEANQAPQAPQAPQPTKRASRRKAKDNDEEEEVDIEEQNEPKEKKAPMKKRTRRTRANDDANDEEQEQEDQEDQQEEEEEEEKQPAKKRTRRTRG
ncbi:hypothetical protein NHQ30_007234 [Ciborinia camelliae]|nr:hypothetical protein NHQ30_007234 [Ciborinia camelliae]